MRGFQNATTSFEFPEYLAFLLYEDRALSYLLFFFFLSSLCLIFPNGLQALCGQGAGLIHLCASPPGSVPGTHEALSKRLQGI